MSRDKQNIKTTDWLTRGIPEEQLKREKQEAIREAEAELRNKQIDEMARDICASRVGASACVYCDIEGCLYREIAIALTAKGYRKASEVAREIFSEIEKKVKASITIHLEEINKEHIKDTPLYDRHSGIIFALRQIEDFLAELKKKYT